MNYKISKNLGFLSSSMQSLNIYFFCQLYLNVRKSVSNATFIIFI